MEELAELFSVVEVDFENNILISIRFQDSSVIIHKRRFPVFTLGLNDRLKSGAGWISLDYCKRV